MDLLAAGFVSALAGAHIAMWGMYKDAPHEGYTHRKFFRAIVLASTIGIVLRLAIPFSVFRADHIVVFFGVVYAIERGLEELYKTFLRVEDQSKYFIPMQFHVLGKVVQSRVARWSVAAGWLLVVALVAILVARSERQAGVASHPVGIILLGGLGGWLSAVGGAAKDAPIEGFEFFKFLRSPLIATAWAVVMAHLTPLVLIIPLAAVGYTVATIETYKTFFFPNRPRGKFAGKPTPYPEWLIRRRAVVPLFGGIWLLVLAAMVAALAGPHNGRI